MGWGTGNIGGGGGGLNFKVVGNPQPANPKENTIWLNTDVDIPGQYLQAEQPEEMANGEVWIRTGTASQVAFNALKKSTIVVYPLFAKQKIDGALVDVTAKSYQNGEWVDWWRGELYKDGKLYNVLADGFETFDDTVVEYKGGYFIYYSNTGSGVIASPEKLNTTGYTKISIVGGLTYQSSVPNSFKVGLATAKDGNSFVSSVQFPNNDTTKTVFVNIPSDGGEYYLVLICSGSTSVNNCVKVAEIVME